MVVVILMGKEEPMVPVRGVRQNTNLKTIPRGRYCGLRSGGVSGDCGLDGLSVCVDCGQYGANPGQFKDFIFE